MGHRHLALLGLNYPQSHMELDTARWLAEALLQQHDLSAWRITFSRKARRRLGSHELEGRQRLATGVDRDGAALAG